MFQEETKIHILFICLVSFSYFQQAQAFFSGGDVSGLSHNNSEMTDKPISANIHSVPLEKNDLCGLEDVVCENETVEGRIRIAARIAGVNEETAVRILKCESGLNPSARNSNSSAKGLAQFIDGTWRWIKAEGSPLNEKDAIREFLKWYPKYPSWWVCR